MPTDKFVIIDSTIDPVDIYFKISSYKLENV